MILLSVGSFDDFGCALDEPHSVMTIKVYLFQIADLTQKSISPLPASRPYIFGSHGQSCRRIHPQLASAATPGHREWRQESITSTLEIFYLQLVAIVSSPISSLPTQHAGAQCCIGVRTGSKSLLAHLNYPSLKPKLWSLKLESESDVAAFLIGRSGCIRPGFTRMSVSTNMPRS